MHIWKYLVLNGYGSKSYIKKIVKESKLIIDKNIICNINEEIDENLPHIIEGIKKYKEYVYLMMNKPSNYVSATKDDVYPPLTSLIKGYEEAKLFTIGRLDVDSEGLILLSNDAKLMKIMTRPEFSIPKKYYVEFSGDINKVDLSLFTKGIKLNNGYITKKAKIEILSSKEVYITIYEGKYHEIKEMFISLGLKVIYLKRIKMGNIELDDSLKKGEYRSLSNDELEYIKELKKGTK